MHLFQIGSNFIKSEDAWPAWKELVKSKNLEYQVQWKANDDFYEIVLVDGSFCYVTTVYRITPPETFYRTAEENAQDLLEFETYWKAKKNKSLRPLEKDGRSIVTLYPAHVGTQNQYVGIVDKILPEGDPGRILFDFSDAGEQESVFQFATPIFLSDGKGVFSGTWTAKDYLVFSVFFPANNSANGIVTDVVGTGNATLTEGIYVPSADSTGDKEIDLTKAVPAILNTHTGFWNVDELTGEITPNLLMEGNAHLLPTENTYEYINCSPIGAADGHWDIEPYRSEFIHQNWVLKVKIVKESTGAGVLAGELLIYRPI